MPKEEPILLFELQHCERNRKMEKKYFMHPSAVVDEGAEIGEATKIWHFTHVMSGAKIGKNCIIGQNAFIGSGVLLENNVKVQNSVSIYDGVVLEDDVFCGPSVVFTNVFNPRSFISRKKEFRKTLVRRGATLGANVTIVCGNTIGQYAFIGAGSVVTKDVPNYALVYGNPAKVKGWVCQCAEEITFRSGRAICKACGKKYKKDSTGVKLI
jgi:UDP-2-acetamido-3-amino-2,3-dideoxy-glucuronate N-acetyltransferase